jgi:MerR family transcriptional regulator, heat shock protein HspR
MTGYAVDPALPFLTVGQVADMLDVQHAFLRRLEAHELVTPGRTEGNQRRYSQDDVDRVSGIVELVDEGLTLAGVRRVLELQAEVTALRNEIKSLRSRTTRPR